MDSTPTFDTDGTYVAGVNIELLEDVSVLTDGIHTIYIWLMDAAGNVNYNNYAATQLYLDNSDPATPSTLIADPDSWTNIDNFNLSWSNPSDTSGIIGAYYKLNSAPTSDDDGTYNAGVDIEQIENILVLSDGIHTIYIWLVDAAGNVNYSNYASIQLYFDNSDPTTPSTVLADPAFWTNIDSFNISWSNPSDTSGIIGVYYKLDLAPTSDYDGIYIEETDIELIEDISVLTDGIHTIYIWLVDAAGNVNYSNYASTQVYLDSSDPTSPSILVASPSSWTSTDNFNVSWSNPSDSSGIVAAYYKLDLAPNSDDDGLYITGTDIELIENILVLTDGIHTIYIWLVDAAGNVNYSNYALTQLYLDTSNPGSPGTLAPTPSSWTNLDNFNLSWVNPTDTSGIAGAYYKLDVAPLSDNDGLYITGVNIESISGISVITDGIHTIYIWLVDAAGNVNHSNYASSLLYLDTIDPSTPISLIASPPSWTAFDSFNLSWSNPSDTSGIVGAYYKLDSAPTSDTDGIYVSGTDIEDILNISVLSDGTHPLYVWLVDGAGNNDYLNSAFTQLYLDSTNPAAPSTLVATPSSWTNTDSFNISWANPSDTSGIVGTYYKLDLTPISDDDGIYTAGADIESVFDISVLTDGIHTIYVWLVDAAGNVNHSNYALTQFYLDVSDPSVPSILIVTPPSWTSIDSFNVSWSNPSDTSGIVGAYYKLDLAPISDTDGTYIASADIETIIDISILTDGIHNIYIWLVDAAGNVNYNNYASTLLYLDTVDPSTPISLIVNPDSWTNIDSFNMSWSNPFDTSGIVGAYYKLNIAPSSDTDGTYVSGADIESVIDISVLTEGTHTIYIWLVDAADNVNYNNYASTLLYLDTVDPSTPISLIANPDSWTNIDSFNVSWSNPFDTSGIVGAYYKLDIAPLSDIDGDYVAGGDIESILDISVLSDGIFTIYVWLIDAAGNVNYINYASIQLFLDTTDPSSPSTLVSNPISWTNIDSFNISWLNPSDTSGIAGAYYKLDLVPTSDDDGIYIAGTDIELIEDISVLTEGTHLVYVWLVDNVGNVDYNNYATTQLYLDTVKPLIIDSQEGDDIWRNTAGTTYNVDFSDASPSSNLDFAQYKITSAPSQGGVLLKDWEDIFTDLGLINYIINWTIDFAMCQEGINYISVRVYDKAGNLEVLNDVFILKKDSLNPLIIDSQTGDDNWRDSGGTVYNIDFSDNSPSSNLDFAQYRITSETGQGGVVLKDWTNIFTDLGATDYTTDWTVDFSACKEGINYVSVRVYDKAGNLAILNDVFYVKKDTIAPIILVNYPLNNTYWNSAPPINISVLEPNLASLTYTVIGYFPINNWLENNTEEILDENIWNNLPQGEFQIIVSGFDTLGHNSEVVLILYKDTLAPILLLNTPVNKTYWNSAPSFNLTAFDPNLDTIWYRVGNVNVTLSNNTLQQLDLSIWDNLPEEGEFHVYFYANDSFGYKNDVIMLTLYKDILTPNLIINSPLNNTYWNLPPDIKVKVFDSYISTIWYRIGSTNVALLNNTSQPLDTSIWNSLPLEGEFIIYFYANDMAGNLNDFFNLRLYKDIRNPSVIINKPKSKDLLGDVSPNFDISIIEAYLNHTWYTLIGGSLNYSFSGLTGKIDQAAWEEFGNGTLTIRFYANDSSGNLGFTDIAFRKYIFAPNISIVSPQDNELFGIDAPHFTINKTGLALNSTWYTLDNGLTNYTFYGSIGIVDQAAWDFYGYQDITITFYINDSFGKIGFDEISIRKDPDPPEVTITFANPANNSYCNSEPTFRVSVYDPNLQRIWYRVGTTNIEITNDTDITLENSIWDTLPQGKFIIEVFAEDQLGYINDPLNLIYYKDTLAPKLLINYPFDHQYYNAPFPINVTVFDPNFISLTYTVIGYLPVNIWLDNNTEVLFNQDIWDNLPQGKFLMSINAYDIFGHYNDTFILSLYKDTLGPTFEVLSPGNYSYHNSPPIFNITSDDPNLQTIWYRVNTTSIELFNNTAQALESSIWENLFEGVFTVDIFGNDSFGHDSAIASITLYKDITLPGITILSPNNNTYYSTPPIMNIFASDINLETVWYTLKGTKIILSGGAEPLDTYLWDTLPEEGEFKVFIFANDSAGNTNDSLILTLYKDTLAPRVFVNSPQNNTYWNSRPILNVWAFDPNFYSISYKVSDYFPLTLLNNTDEIFDIFLWLTISDGEFILEIFAEDSLGNINDSIKLTLYKDTFAPDITINLPKSNDLFGSTAPNFNVSVIESNLDSTWYILLGESANFKFTGSTGTIDQTTWGKFGSGIVIIRFYANDTAGNIVYKDVTVRKDIFAPTITINSPGINELGGVNAPHFIIYKSGAEIQATWYTLDNGLTNYTFTGLSGTINQDAWNNYGYEIVTIRFYINNSLGKIGYDEVVVRKDPDAPVILANSPFDQTSFALAPFINITVEDPNLHMVWYSIDNIKIDLTGNLTQYLDSFIWNNLAEGTFILEFFANDTLGNLNNLIKLYLAKDTIGPNITIILPDENQRVDRNAPLFELSILDQSDIGFSWYTFDGDNTTVRFTGTLGRIDQELWESFWDNLTQGSIITIRFYSTDILGNVNYKDVNVTKYQPSKLLKIESNPLGFIISTLGLVVIIPITSKLTKSRYYQSLNKKEKGKLKKVVIAAFLLVGIAIIFSIF
ncbi:MAG: hypothetical protein ACXABO_16875 [Promethearchaeota archaeon]